MEFAATLPDIQSAISVSGAGNGARIKLDVPNSDLAEVLKLVLYQGQLLKVKVEVIEEEDAGFIG